MRLMLVASTLLLALGSADAIGHDPWQMSYSKAPGFHATFRMENFEWGYKSTTLPDPGEPAVPISRSAPSGLRIRWLGTSGFEISDDETSVLVDPFASRAKAVPVLLMQPLDVNTSAVDRYILDGLDLSKVKVILNAHTHHDHVQDIPYILAKYARASDRPLVVGDPNLRKLLESYRDPRCKVPWMIGIDPLASTPQYIVQFDEALREYPPAGRKLGSYVGTFGHFKVTAFINRHALYDLYPFLKVDGDIEDHPPLRSNEYKAFLHSTLSYLVEYKDQFRIYLTDTSGLIHSERMASEIGRIDLLLQGIAGRENQDDTAKYIAGFKPRYFVPTHYDDFMQPLDGMKEFDYKILLTDHSELQRFLDEFKPRYLRQAEAEVGPTFVPPRLRLMKLLYYYSLEGALRN